MGVASECRANPRAYGPHEIPAPARPHGVSHGFMGVTSRHRPHRPRKHAASGGRRAPWLRSDVSLWTMSHNGAGRTAGETYGDSYPIVQDRKSTRLNSRH